MELIRGLHNLRAAHRGCVATIGTFDGVHLGHQAVLQQLRARAEALGVPMAVVIFEPQPQEYFQQARAPARITRLREKLRALERYGADRVLCMRFDERLAQMDAQQFIDRVLVHGLGVRFLVVGDDFRFGHGRSGDFHLLERSGHVAGFEVAHMATHIVAGGRVSSTRVRKALGAGDMALAAQLLGRPYAMSGRVAHGARRGRTIGFPTANIHLHRRVSPVAGVYAVRLHGIDGGPHPGVANVGTRPTVDGTQAVLEVHVFDFAREIYGAHVEVEFLTRLRDERKFESFDALRRQIEMDAAQARHYLAQPPRAAAPH